MNTDEIPLGVIEAVLRALETEKLTAKAKYIQPAAFGATPGYFMEPTVEQLAQVSRQVFSDWMAYANVGKDFKHSVNVLSKLRLREFLEKNS